MQTERINTGCDNIPVYSSSRKHDCQIDLFPNDVTLTGGRYEVKSVGTVSLQLIETRSSQRRTDKARADHELKVMILDLKGRPSKARLVGVHSSMKDGVPENSNQMQHVLPEVQEDTRITCHDRVTESGKSSVGLKKVPTTPVSSTWTEFDIVTPKEDKGGLQTAGAARRRPTSPVVDGPGSLHSGEKG